MIKTAAAPRAHEQQAPAARVFGPLTRVFNPLAIRFAGSAYVPLWAIIRHRGRRSGRLYATPVAIGHMPDVLVVPLPFGPDVDWCRNVRSAGGCVVRWKGQEHQMTDPEIVEDAGVVAFAKWERTALRALGIKQFLRLRFAHAAD
jgi:deazaflavin-dependent oxidoreductase (nitroreductase family)